MPAGDERGRKMKKDNQKIEKALAAAYRNLRGPEPGEDWEMSVMRSIRNMPDASEKKRWPDILGRLFWKVCPAACAVIIFLAIVSYNLNVIPDQDLAQMVSTDDTIEMILADTNG